MCLDVIWVDDLAAALFILSENDTSPIAMTVEELAPFEVSHI